jgi:uncharacterized protein (DUF885 family)
MQKILSLLLLFVFVPSAQFAQSGPEPAAQGDAAFNRMMEEYLAGYLRWRPLMGTSLGLHEYDGKLTDFSKVSLDLELTRLNTFARRLAELDPTKLSRQAFYDFRILRGAINREIFSFEKMRIYSRNPMTYAGAVDVNVYIKRNFAPLENRVRSIVSILNQASRVMVAARQNLEDSLPRTQIETAIDQATGAADFLAKDLVLALKDLNDASLKAEFEGANLRAIEEMRGYAKYLKDEKLPKANDRFAIGRDNYIKLLEYGEMITLPPEAILEIGLRELKLKQQVFAETAREIDPTKKAIDVFKEIQKDHPTEKSLIPDTARNMEMIRQFLIDHKIITLPSPVRAIVKETPQFLRATSFASMDTPGPFETKATEAYYYVTPVEPDWPPAQKEEWLTAFNFYTTDIVSVHEAYPGHYVQYLCLNASPATKLEKIFVGYAFSEGWAHYAEQMMVDEGFGGAQSRIPSREDLIRGAKYRLAQADEALLRLCRLCVSIKMHCQEMSVDAATKFFQDNCYYEQKPARQEAVRGTYDPEFLYYTIGKLEIFKLRNDYRKQERENFSLQKFHDEMLRHGAPPIRLLREIMLKDRKLWGEVL